MLRNVKHRICSLGVAAGLIAVAFALAATFGVPRAEAAGYYPLGTWSSVRTLSDPQDVAYAMTGNIYVADGNSRRIAVFSASTGDFLFDFDGSDRPDGNLAMPQALAIGPDARLYVADSAADVISVFDLSGSWVSTIGAGLNNPTDLAFSADGNLYVADMGNNRIHVITTSGALVRDITGTGQSLIRSPVGVSLSDRLGYAEEVYVAEINKVRVFSKSGTQRTTWGIISSGTTTSRYYGLTGIEAVHVNGSLNPTIFVIDAGTSGARWWGVIEPCDPNGNPSASVAFNSPRGMTPFTGNRYLVAEGGLKQVTDSNMVAPITQMRSAPATGDIAAKTEPVGVAAWPDGSYVVADAKYKSLRKYDASGTEITTFTPSSTTSAAPAGVAISADGQEIYVCEPASSTVQVYDADGNHLRTLGGAGQFQSPIAVSTRPDGDLAVADSGLRQVVFVSRIDASQVSTPTPQLAGTITGVAVAADGKVYLSDSTADRIERYASDGTFEAVVAQYGSGPGWVNDPSGLSVTTSGELLVAEAGNNRLQRLTVSGQPSTIVFGALGSARGKFAGPKAVAAMTQGRVLIADTGNGRVVQARLDSTLPTTNASGDVNAVVNHSVTVTLSATDEGSGVAHTYYRLTRPNGQIQVGAYTQPIVISEEGTTSIGYWSVDRVGNTEPDGQMVYAKIDYTPPAGTTIFARGAGTMLNPGPIAITSSYDDALEMRLGTVSNPGLYWVDYSPDATLTITAEGPTRIVAEYRDRAGNIAVRTFDCIIDGTGPVSSILPAGDQAALGSYGHVNVLALPALPGGGPTFKGPVAVSLSATDALTPVSKILYRLDSAPATEYVGSPLAVTSSDATHLVEAWAVDGAGNTGSHTFTTFGISRLPAGGPLVLGDGSGATSVTALPWRAEVYDAVRVNWDCGSGFAPQDSEYPSTTPWVATLPAVDDRYQVSVRFKDSIGSVVDLIGSVTLDTVAPQTAIILERVPHGWASSVTHVLVSGTDPVPASGNAPSGVAIRKYRLDDGVVATFTGIVPFLVDRDGAHTVEAWSVDGAGNVSSLETTTFTVSHLPSGGTLAATNGRSVFATSTVNMSTSIQSARRMRWNTGGAWSAPDDPALWSPFSATFDVKFSGEGTRTVNAQFVDDYAQTNMLSAQIVIDRSGPVTTIVRSPDATAVAPPVAVTINALDAYSAVLKREYKVDGSAQTFQYGAPLQLSLLDGEHWVDAWATDVLGNVGPSTTTTFTVSRLLLGGTVSLAGGAAHVGSYVMPATVAAQSATQMQWSTGGSFSDWVSYSASPFNVTFSSEGTQTLVVRLRDKLGIEIEAQDSVFIDRTPPVTTFESMPPSGVCNGPMVMHFSASDASAIAYIEYSLDGAAWRRYTVPVLVSSGSHTLSYRSADQFGNVELAKSAVFSIANDPLGSIVVNGGKPFANTNVLGVVLNLAEQRRVSFSTGSGWSAATTYTAPSSVTVPGDGLYLVQAAIVASSGAETTLCVPIVVDRTPPSVWGLNLSVPYMRLYSTGYRYRIGMSAAASDAHPLSSSIASWRWTVGSYYARTAGYANFYGLRNGTFYPTANVYDRAGNRGFMTGKLRLGVATRPSVPTSARANRYFTVRGYVPVPAYRSAYRISCYKRYSNGTWYLKKNVAVAPSISGSTARVYKRIYLPRGTWKVVIVGYKGGYVNAGVPSATIAVR
jgi:DNA-binding beta-propeller fold protein YncE